MRNWSVARLALALVSFVPFAPGLLTGGSFFYRDLSYQFFPIRRFVVEGLLRGELRRWNPLMNEGTPLALPPLAYPIDWLQALAPSEWGFSLLLALHVPLAALTFLDLGRRLGHGPLAATLGALVYALSGFSLSSVNLYLHVQAFAWAPLVISMLIRASTAGAREIAVAGAAVGLCLSTAGVEIAAQALACGFVLAASRSVGGHLRLAAGIALGIGLAASPLVGLFSLVTGSRRASGLGVAEALDQSVHPVSLLQTLVAGLHGDPVASGYAYWGARFWGGPSPYFLSLYLGGAVLCLVALGARSAARHRTRLLLLLVAGLVICLGRWARFDLLLETAPFLAKFRFPVKAFFTVVLASSLLASAAADTLLASRRAWRPLLVGSAVLGFALLSLSLAPAWLPGRFPWLQGWFFLEAYPQDLRGAALRAVATDAALGAVPLLAVAAIAALTLRQRLSAEIALAATTAVIAADLLRAGAGLNPTTHSSFYALSPEMSQVAAKLRETGGRAFTCSIYAMPTFRDAVRRVGRPDLWTASVWRESLSPFTNMDAGIATTGVDPTALVSSARSLSQADAMCRDPGTLPRLRASGVRYILSVQPFTNEALRPAYVASPARTAPLSVHVYELEGALPDPTLWLGPDDVDEHGRGRALDGAVARYVSSQPDLVRVSVETPQAAYLILRRTHGRGWSASVAGKPAEIVTANGRHQALAVPPGKSEVVLSYRAPNARLGLALSLISAFVAAGLWIRSSPSAQPQPQPKSSG